MRFLYLYHGGRMPQDDAGVQKMMDAWNAYFGKISASLADGGAPLAERVVLGGGEASSVTGYSIIEAEDMEAAKALCDSHPHLDYDGRIEICTMAEM